MNELKTIKEELKSLGFNKIKHISGKRIAVLIDTHRVEALEKINKNFEGSTYDRTPRYYSGAGMVHVNGIGILAKPINKQGRKAAGIENEYVLMKGINNRTRRGPLNIIFKAGDKEFSIQDVKKVTHVGNDTTSRKKADIMLHDIHGNKYPISIKQANSEYWESTDTYFSDYASTIIQKAIEEGHTTLHQHDSFYKISPNLAIEHTQEEKELVAFGSDILNGGAIVQATFSRANFKRCKDTLTITCNHVITSIQEINGDHDAFLLIRNDKTRNSIKGFPGLRVLAAHKKRINKNVVVLNR